LAFVPAAKMIEKIFLPSMPSWALSSSETETRSDYELVELNTYGTNLDTSSSNAPNLGIDIALNNREKQALLPVTSDEASFRFRCICRAILILVTTAISIYIPYFELVSLKISKIINTYIFYFFL
jgi:hypothetical protein